MRFIDGSVCKNWSLLFKIRSSYYYIIYCIIICSICLHNMQTFSSSFLFGLMFWSGQFPLDCLYIAKYWKCVVIRFNMVYIKFLHERTWEFYHYYRGYLVVPHLLQTFINGRMVGTSASNNSVGEECRKMNKTCWSKAIL